MRDIRTLLILILCISVLSFGSYFMYKILDPVDNELVERDKIYLKLYIDEDGSISSEKNEYPVLKIETPYEGAKLVSYAKDDFSDQVNYVLYSLKGLNIYNVKILSNDIYLASFDSLNCEFTIRRINLNTDTTESITWFLNYG